MRVEGGKEEGKGRGGRREGGSVLSSNGLVWFVLESKGLGSVGSIKGASMVVV